MPSFAKLDDNGTWCVRFYHEGPPLASGSVVNVPTKSGKTWEVVIGDVLKIVRQGYSFPEVFICAILKKRSGTTTLEWKAPTVATNVPQSLPITVSTTPTQATGSPKNHIFIAPACIVDVPAKRRGAPTAPPEAPPRFIPLGRCAECHEMAMNLKRCADIHGKWGDCCENCQGYTQFERTFKPYKPGK